MAADYATGSAASFTDLQTAVENFLVSFGGWTGEAGPAGSRLLSKAGLFVELAAATNSLTVFGGTGITASALTGKSPFGSKLGSPTGSPITFPITYEIYWNDTPEEIYIVINYNGDRYQHLHWGQSDIADIGGTGLWYDGSYDSANSLGSTEHRQYWGVGRNENYGNGVAYVQNYGGLSGGYQWNGDGANWRGGGIHCGLEGADNWRYNHGTSAGELRRNAQSGGLLMALPSLFNSTAVLLPIYFTLRRTDSVDTPVAVLRHARYTRMDNVNPGDIISYGADQWKFYPVYIRNVTNRNGFPWISASALHSGTFGVALRYPGV